MDSRILLLVFYLSLGQSCFRIRYFIFCNTWILNSASHLHFLRPFISKLTRTLAEARLCWIEVKVGLIPSAMIWCHLANLSSAWRSWRYKSTVYNILHHMFCIFCRAYSWKRWRERLEPWGRTATWGQTVVSCAEWRRLLRRRKTMARRRRRCRSPRIPAFRRKPDPRALYHQAYVLTHSLKFTAESVRLMFYTRLLNHVRLFVDSWWCK